MRAAGSAGYQGKIRRTSFMQTFEMQRLKSYGFGEVLLGDVLMFMSVFSFVVAAAGED